MARTLLRSSRVASPTHVDAFTVVRTCAARIEQMLAAGEPQVVDNPFQLYLEQSSIYLWRIDAALGRHGGPSQLRQAAELVRELNSLERRVRWAEVAGKSLIATVTLLQFPVCAAADARLTRGCCRCSTCASSSARAARTCSRSSTSTGTSSRTP